MKGLECTWHIVSYLSVSYCFNGEREADEEERLGSTGDKMPGPLRFLPGFIGKSGKEKGMDIS